MPAQLGSIPSCCSEAELRFVAGALVANSHLPAKKADASVDSAIFPERLRPGPEGPATAKAPDIQRL